MTLEFVVIEERWVSVTVRHDRYDLPSSPQFGLFDERQGILFPEMIKNIEGYYDVEGIRLELQLGAIGLRDCIMRP